MAEVEEGCKLWPSGLALGNWETSVEAAELINPRPQTSAQIIGVSSPLAIAGER